MSPDEIGASMIEHPALEEPDAKGMAQLDMYRIHLHKLWQVMKSNP